jgi:hypothetical protein
MKNSHESKTVIAAIWALPTIDEQIAAACDLAAPRVHPDIRDLFRRLSAEKRTAMSRADCEALCGWKTSTQNARQADGTLRTVLDGVRRLVTVSSVYQYLVARMILSNPVGKPAPKSARVTGFGRSKSHINEEGLSG